VLESGDNRGSPILFRPAQSLRTPHATYVPDLNLTARAPAIVTAGIRTGEVSSFGEPQHYSSFIAPTDSFANPIELSPPLVYSLVEESLQVAASPCCSWDLPDAIPQFFPQMPGPQSRRSHQVHLPVSSLMSAAFPRPFLGRLPVSSANTIFPR
jgi:hypothetical protein